MSSKTPIEPVIKWSGSKRSQAGAILQHMPDKFNTYYEPFLGGGSVLCAVSPASAVCGDICTPLIQLWKLIQSDPDALSAAYATHRNNLQQYGSEYYYKIRDRFNTYHQPEDLLFLSRTCFNGLIRFSRQGRFNSSFHITRDGIKPETLDTILHRWSDRIQNVQFVQGDYRDTTAGAAEGDIVYLDPPYFNSGAMYYGCIKYDDFVEYLNQLNKRNVKFILSLDGRRGNTDYTVELPKQLYKRHELLQSGQSSFSRLTAGTKVEVQESLYMNF